MKQSYIDFKMPSIMGMGAVGPTLSVLTASLYGALNTAMEAPPHWLYPAIMLVLAALLAVFPVAKERLPKWQKLALWPIVAVIIFAAAWGTNHGLSVGEEAISGNVSRMEMPSLIPSAYAQSVTTNRVDYKSMTNLTIVVEVRLSECKTNEVEFATVDFKRPIKVNQAALKGLPAHVWGLEWSGQNLVFLRAKSGKWSAYRKRIRVKSPPNPDVSQKAPRQQKLHGGFFKRWK